VRDTDLVFLTIGSIVSNASFGANAPPSLIPHPHKALFDKLVKNGDLGSTQILLFQRS
jgi:hypothetical protein